jgi:cytoskeletal protein CcmA (bactofilin family)
MVTSGVDIGGSIETSEGVAASFVRIGRRGEAKGSIRAKEVIVGERARVEDVYADKIILEEKAQARNLYGQTIHLEYKCEIVGEVLYTEHLETEEDVHFAKPPMKVEKLPQ